MIFFFSQFSSIHLNSDELSFYQITWNNELLFFLLQYPLVNPPIMNEGPAVEMDPTPLRKMLVDVISEKSVLLRFGLFESDSKSPKRCKTDFSEFSSTGTRVCGYIATLMSPVPCFWHQKSNPPILQILNLKCSKMPLK